MIHEILISLSGYDSPLFGNSKDDASTRTSLPLSSAEQQILSSVELLSRQYRILRQRLDLISRSHPSVICRAIANAVQQVQLKRYQDTILDVERDILAKDASLVGAYNIVPLSSVLERFDEWRYRFKYLLEVSDYIGDPGGHHSCSGAAIINKLRVDAHTGFSDLESIANDLSKAAELAWLRQLATWLMHGSINKYGAGDFFISQEVDSDGRQSYVKRTQLLPDFVEASAAGTALTIGRTLARIVEGDHGKNKVPDSVKESHLKLISDIAVPIQSKQLSSILAQIKASVSKNVLQLLIPPQQVSMGFTCFDRYFLLQDGEFAVALIEEADRVKETRWRDTARLQQTDPLKALQGLSLKEEEINQVLRLTWKRVSLLESRESDEKTIDFARAHMSLTSSRRIDRPSTSDSPDATIKHVSSTTFSDLLLPGSASLWLSIQAPLDLIVTTFDVQQYSALNAYLLALHRGRSRLCELWRLSRARRSRARTEKCDRQSWAACSSVVSFLTHVLAFLNEEVIAPECKHFTAWVRMGQDTAMTADGRLGLDLSRDPEAIAQAHRQHLNAIVHGSLIFDTAYTKTLRALLGTIDQVTAQFIRFLDVQQQAQESRTATQTDTSMNEVLEARRQLDQSCFRMQSLQVEVVGRLQELSEAFVNDDGLIYSPQISETYGPRRIANLDHLLVKLQDEHFVEGADDDDDV